MPLNARADARFCSERCRSKYRRRRGRSRRFIYSSECFSCQNQIEGRFDKVYCSPACRQAAYRRHDLASKPIEVNIPSPETMAERISKIPRAQRETALQQMRKNMEDKLKARGQSLKRGRASIDNQMNRIRVALENRDQTKSST